MNEAITDFVLVGVDSSGRLPLALKLAGNKKRKVCETLNANHSSAPALIVDDLEEGEIRENTVTGECEDEGDGNAQDGDEAKDIEKMKQNISDDNKERKKTNWGCAYKDGKNEESGKTMQRENIESEDKKRKKTRKINNDFISRRYLVTVASDMGLDMVEKDLEKVIEKTGQGVL